MGSPGNDMLHEKCTRLHTQAQVQAMRITELENMVKATEQKRTEYEDVTIKLRGLWDQLCEDLSLLAKQALSELADREALPKPKMQVNGTACKDPFLAALVASDADIAEERFREEARLEEDYSAVEKALQDRAHQTGAYMQKLLELVRALRDRASSHATNSSAPLANGGPARHDQVAPLRRQLEVQLGKSRSLQSDLRHCRGQLSAERNRCQDLENRLADKESEIDIVRKRQFRAQDTEAPGAEPSAALNLNVAADAAAAPSEDAAPQASTSTPGAAHADVQLALQHCNSRLQKAYSDLDIEKEAHCRTRQAVQAAEAKFQNESEWVPRTGMYQRQSTELARLQEAVVTANAERMRAEADARLQCEALGTKRKEFAHVTRIAAIEEERAQRLEVQLHKARADALKREAELIEQRDSRGEPETFQELKKFVDSYNTVRASLDRCLASLEASRKAKLADAPTRADSEAGRRADAVEQELRDTGTRASDAEYAAASHRKAHNDALVANAELQAMLTAVCAFAEFPTDVLECRAAEERAREELAAVRAAAAAAAAAGAQGMDKAVAAAAQSVAKAPEPRSAVVEAELWQARAAKARGEVDAVKSQDSKLQREVQRLTEELEQAKEYEGEMVREVSDTGEAFAKLQSERAKALELQTASDEKVQAAGRQCAALSRSLQFKEDEVARLAANVKERDVAVGVAELRQKELAEARADAERARTDRDAAAAAAAAAEAAQAAAKAREVDLDASVNHLQRQVGEKSSRVTELELQVVEHESKRQRNEATMKELQERVVNSGQSDATKSRVDALQQENESLKSFVRCPVCNTRPRSCVITKCWHMFCKQCVMQRLGQRSRKCPSCGIAFSHNDYHDIFL